MHEGSKEELRFNDAAARFANRGKIPTKDLLPIIPPSAKISTRSSIKDFQLGKIPGRYNDNTKEWAGMHGPWPTLGMSDRDQRLAADWPTANVGLRAADWPAIDCDINDQAIADWVGRRVKTMLGFAPMRVRGNSPRCLFVFRRMGNDTVRKMQLIFNWKGEEHKVEILGAGQQYVINGIHPSGVAYDWAPDAHLADVSVDGLERVTEAQLRDFLEALSKEITEKGGEVTRLALPTRGAGAQGQGVAVSELDPLMDPPLALTALNSFKNDEDTLPSREQFVGVTASFKATLGREADANYEAFIKWATAEDWADADYVETVWDSLAYVRTGPEVMFRLARQHGWHGDTLLDFQNTDDAEIDRKIAAAQQSMSDEEKEVKDLADKLCYVAEQQRWIVRGNGGTLTHEALNKYPGLGTTISDAGATGRATAANKLINSGLVTQVEGVTYLPARENLTTWHNDGRVGLYYNRWHDNNETLLESVTDDDVRPWLDHAKYLFPDEKERDTLLDWLAHVVQKRGVKIRWAPLIIGGQGVGKDILIKPVAQYLAHNYQEVGPDRLFNQFNSYMEREMIVVQEMVRYEKIEAYEKLKAMLAGTAGDTVLIERKYEMPYSVPNITNYLFFSNHTDAVKLDPEDRRFFVIRTDAKPKGEAYYRALAEDFYVRMDGWRRVIRWLKQRDLTEFLTHQCPEMTEAKREMVDNQQPVLCRWLREATNEGGIWADRTVLTSNYVFTQSRENYSLPIREADRREIHKPFQASSALKYAGWVRNSTPVRVQGQVTCLWAKDAKIAARDASALRDTFEAEINPNKENDENED